MKKPEYYYLVARSKKDPEIYFSRYRDYPGRYDQGIKNALPFESKACAYKVLTLNGESIRDWDLVRLDVTDFMEIYEDDEY